jgi:hypothetical protein
VKSVGQYEKLENHKIFELQKKQYALPAAMREGSLREKTVFAKPTLLPQTPFVKTYPQFSP